MMTTAMIMTTSMSMKATMMSEVSFASLPSENSRGEVLFSADNLSVGYAGRALLPPLSFDFCRGSVTAILGRNGSGKSTLMKTLLGELKPVSGTVRRRVPAMKAALMPQTRDLDFQLPVTVREFVSWGALSGLNFLRRPWTTRQEKARVEEALAELGLTAIGDRFLNELSEGQQQRVLFARILATDADAALLDEPTAAMDAVFQREVVEILSRTARERRLAVVIITHALELVGSLADAVIFLDDESKTVLSGSRDEVFRSDAFRARFHGVTGTGKALPDAVPNSANAPQTQEVSHG